MRVGSPGRWGRPIVSQTSPLPLSESTEQRRDSVGRQAWVQKLVGSTAVDKLFNLSGLFSHLGHGNSRPSINRIGTLGEPNEIIHVTPDTYQTPNHSAKWLHLLTHVSQFHPLHRLPSALTFSQAPPPPPPHRCPCFQACSSHPLSWPRPKAPL